MLDPLRMPSSSGERLSAIDAASVLFWTLDIEMQADWLNSPWERYSGCSLATLRENGWLEAVHAEDRERCVGVFAASRAAGMPFSIDYRLRRHDGMLRWFTANGTPRRNTRGELAGFICSALDIHDRRELEDQLAERARLRRHADGLRDEFLAMLSHELRNPLSVISNASSSLASMHRDDPDLQRVRQILERQVAQLRRLVDDVVDVTRLTQGKITLQPRRLSLEELVHTAVESVQPKLDALGHQLQLRLPFEEVNFVGDVIRLSQALSNLIGNAAKFTPHPGFVTLTATVGDGELVLRVRDRGIGIPADFLPHMFDLFAQYDQSLARSHGGVGVGLTIARRIAQLHGGDLNGYSEGNGLGAEFVLSLPLPGAYARGAISRATLAATRSPGPPGQSTTH